GRGWFYRYAHLKSIDPTVRPGQRVNKGQKIGGLWRCSPLMKVRSDGNAKPHAPDGYAETVHRFEKPGQYLVRVEQNAKNGTKVTARLHVTVATKPESKPKDER